MYIMLHVINHFAVVMSFSYPRYHRLLLAVLGVYLDHICILYTYYYVLPVLICDVLFLCCLICRTYTASYTKLRNI
jgi:hypothetical protein